MDGLGIKLGEKYNNISTGQLIEMEKLIFYH